MVVCLFDFVHTRRSPCRVSSTVCSHSSGRTSRRSRSRLGREAHGVGGNSDGGDPDDSLAGSSRAPCNHCRHISLMVHHMI